MLPHRVSLRISCLSFLSFPENKRWITFLKKSCIIFQGQWVCPLWKENILSFFFTFYWSKTPALLSAYSRVADIAFTPWTSLCVCVCGDITLVTGKTDLGPGNIMSPLKDITVKYTMWKGPYTLFQFYGFMMRTWWKKSSGPNSLRSG